MMIFASAHEYTVERQLRRTVSVLIKIQRSGVNMLYDKHVEKRRHKTVVVELVCRQILSKREWIQSITCLKWVECLWTLRKFIGRKTSQERVIADHSR